MNELTDPTADPFYDVERQVLTGRRIALSERSVRSLVKDVTTSFYWRSNKKLPGMVWVEFTDEDRGGVIGPQRFKLSKNGGRTARYVLHELAHILVWNVTNGENKSHDTDFIFAYRKLLQVTGVESYETTHKLLTESLAAGLVTRTVDIRVTSVFPQQLLNPETSA